MKKYDYDLNETDYGTDGGGLTYDPDTGIYSSRDLYGTGRYASKWEKSWYLPYYLKPKPDLSVNIRTRIESLIKTISGASDIRLEPGRRWELLPGQEILTYDDQETELSDDALLGRISHLLAWQINPDASDFWAKLPAEQDTAKGLLEQLEDLRADTLLAREYPGTDFFRKALWLEKNRETAIYYAKSDHYYPSVHDKDAKTAIQFLSDLKFLANGETIAKNSPANGAAKALQKFLTAPDFAAAWPHYLEIKKLFPQLSPDATDRMQEVISLTNLPSLRAYEESLRTASYTDPANSAGNNNGKQEAKGKERGLLEVKPQDMRNFHYHESYGRMKKSIEILHRLLAAVLRENEAMRYNRPYRRGKLDTKRLYKLALQNPRLFKQKRQNSKRNYGFVLAVDISGSMQGLRSRNALDAAVLISHVLDRLEIPFSVLAFNGAVFPLKKFGQRINPEELSFIANPHGGTNDTDALLEAIKLLRPRAAQLPETQNQIIVITDGHGDSPGSFAQLHKKLPQVNASLLGISIGMNDIRQIKARYPKYLSLGSPDALPRTLAGVLAANFKRY